MAITVVLIAFMGLATNRWLEGLVAMVPISALLTTACFITTNNPAFTEIEHALELTASSVASNFLLKLLCPSGAYSVGFLCVASRRKLASNAGAATGHSDASDGAVLDQSNRRPPSAPQY